MKNTQVHKPHDVFHRMRSESEKGLIVMKYILVLNYCVTYVPEMDPSIL